MSFNDELSTPGEVACSYHPDVQTLLRCSRCGKPICPQCGVRTPVGMRCPECAGVRGLPTYRTGSRDLLVAGLFGFAVAISVGVLWGYFPSWQFYLALLLGFGISESMARVVREKRGLDLQITGWLAVLTGLIVSRVVLAWRLDLPWDVISELDPIVERVMYLQLIPDGVFALLPLIIVYIRFR